MTDHTKWAAFLVKRLVELSKPDNIDRETLAHLRRGLCGPSDFTLSRVGWLFRGVPDDTSDRALDSALLAVGLFAWVKGNCPHSSNTNFGRAFGHNLSDDDKKQREKRFTDLLDTDIEDLPYKLRQAVTLIEGVPIDWEMLIHDLIGWSHPDRWVQKKWARGFWSNPRLELADIGSTTNAN